MKRGKSCVRHSARDLRFEWLEDRQLLSVAPSLPVAAYVQPLVKVVDLPVQPLSLQEGATNQVVKDMFMYGTKIGQYVNVRAIAFAPAIVGETVSDSVYDNVAYAVLRADLDGRASNGCEALIGAVTPDAYSDAIVMPLRLGTYLRPGKPFHVQLFVTMRKELVGQNLGLEFAGMDCYNIWGKSISPDAVSVTGSPTMHTLVETPKADAWMTLSAPPSVTVGQSFEVNYTVGNNGPDVASNVTLDLNGSLISLGSMAPGNWGSGTATFSVDTVGMYTLSGFVTSQVTDPNDANNTAFATVDVQAQPALVTIGIDGPVSQEINPGDDNVNLANIEMDVSPEQGVYGDAFVMIVGQDVGGGPFKVGIADFMEDVELRDTATGRAIDGVRLTGTGDYGQTTNGTYQVYRFDDVQLSGLSRFELLSDFEGPVAAGDHFRVYTSASYDAVSFDGFVAPTKVYNPVLRDLEFNQLVDLAPGGYLAGNWHEVVVPRLLVGEKSGPTTDTAVKNQKNIVTNRFDAYADGADELLTKVVVTAAEGDLRNCVNYTLWVSTTGNGVDTILQKNVSVVNGQVTFDNLTGGGYVVSNEQIVRFEVHADVAGSFVSNPATLRAELAGLEAERMDTGASIDWGIGYQPQTLWSFRSQGSAYVILDGNVQSSQMLAGTLSEPVLWLEAAAIDEDVDFTRIQISVMNGTAQSIDCLELYRARAGTSFFAVATVSGVGTDPSPEGYTTFQANMMSQQFVVAKGTAEDIVVRARVRSDVNGGVSGEQDQFFIAADTCTVQARGVQSSNNLLPNDGDGLPKGEVLIGTDFSAGPNRNVESSAMHTVVCSKIVSITNANPDANGTSIVAGIKEGGVFQITAAANVNTKNGLNKVVDKKFVFVFDTANVEYGSRFELLNKVNPSVTVAATAILKMDGTPWGSDPIHGQFQVVFDNLPAAVDTVLGSGESDTIAVRYNRTNPQVSAVDPSREQVFLSLAKGDVNWYDEDNASSMLLDWVDNPDSRVLIGDYAG